MAAQGIPIWIPALTDDSGRPLSGAKVYAWLPDSNGAPTNTPVVLYTDAKCTTPASNPYTSSAGGRSVLYRTPATTVVVIVKNSAGSITYSTVYYPTGAEDGNFGDGWDGVLSETFSGARFFATYALMTAETDLIDNAIYCSYARAAEEDGGFGFWRYDSASTTTANGGTILAVDGGGAGRFFRLTDGINYDVHWWPVAGNGSTDDSSAINTAIAAVGAAGGGIPQFPAA